MNEPVENSVDYVNNSPEEPLPPLTWRDSAAPLLPLILAWLFWSVFAVRDMGYFGPGAGVPVFVGCYFGTICLMLGKPEKRALGRAALSLLLCIPLLAVVIALLSSADAVFGSIFERLGGQLRELTPGASLWKILRTLVLTLFIASGLYFLRMDAPFALTAWCVFCLATPDGIIAGYNVDHYLSGDLETVDTSYLEQLGTDALPALYRLENGEGDYAINAAARHAGYETSWSRHKLSYRHLPEN